MRTITLVLVLLILSGCSIKQEVKQTGPSEGTAMAKLLDIPGGLKITLEQSVTKLYLTDPETAETFAGLSEKLDYDKTAAYVGAIIDEQLTDQDRQDIRSYVDDPSSERIAALYKKYKNPGDIVEHSRSLPERDRQHFEKFVKSPAWQKTLQTISSHEFMAQLADYVDKEICSWVLNKADLHVYAALVQEGKCQ